MGVVWVGGSSCGAVRSALIAAVLAITIALTSGCAYHSSRRTAKSGVGLLVAGALSAALAHRSECTYHLDGTGDLGCMWDAVTPMLLVSGLVVTGVGLAGIAIYDKPEPDVPLPAEQLSAEGRRKAVEGVLEKRRDDAWALTKAAAAAARAGDCKTVRKLDRRVLGLDADFHNTVFLADVGIGRCLEPAITAPLAPQSSPAVDPVGP